MKNLIIILLVLAPSLCFGQRNDIQNIKVSELAKMVSVKTIPVLDNNVSDIIKIKTPERKEFWINCGCSSKNKGNALVLIDGIKGNLNDVKAEDIESFKILKEKNEIAEYGVAGKNGVVLVTTKSYVEKNRKEEYEVIVFDAGYDGFLAMQKPKEFYSESYLKSKNALMVNEWNYRYRLPRQYSSDIYEVSIDYDTNTDYGLDVEYKIYMFLRFMEKEHSMSLIKDRLTAKI